MTETACAPATTRTSGPIGEGDATARCAHAAGLVNCRSGSRCGAGRLSIWGCAAGLVGCRSGLCCRAGLLSIRGHGLVWDRSVGDLGCAGGSVGWWLGWRCRVRPIGGGGRAVGPAGQSVGGAGRVVGARSIGRSVAGGAWCCGVRSGGGAGPAVGVDQAAVVGHAVGVDRVAVVERAVGVGRVALWGLRLGWSSGGWGVPLTRLAGDAGCAGPFVECAAVGGGGYSDDPGEVCS